MTTEPFDLRLTAEFETVEGGWTQASVQELPGVVTCAATHDEAREILADAAREWLLAQAAAAA